MTLNLKTHLAVNVLSAHCSLLSSPASPRHVTVTPARGDAGVTVTPIVDGARSNNCVVTSLLMSSAKVVQGFIQTPWVWGGE